MDGICVLDPNFNVLAYNDTAYTEFLKYAGVDLSLSESSIQEQLTESEFTRWKEDVFGRVFKGESFVNIIKREDNRTFRNKYTPVIDDHGELLGGLEVSQDITDYVESRSALQLIEDSLKSVIDHNPAGIARINTEGRITYTSERGAELFGYLPDEMKGNLAIKYIADTDHEVFFSSIKSLLEGEQEIIMDLNVKSKSGIRTFKGITTLVRDDKDDPVEFFLSYMDISSTLENQLKLEDIENKYEKLFSNMQDGAIIWHQCEGRIVEYNQALKSMFGYSDEALRSRPFSEFFAETSSQFNGSGYKSRLEGAIGRVCKGDFVKEVEMVIVRPDGTEKLVELSFISFDNEHNYVYIIVVDKTFSYQAALEIEEKSSLFEALIHNSFECIDVVKCDIDADKNYVNPRLLIRNKSMAELTSNDSSETFHTIDQLHSISPELQPEGSPSYDLLKSALAKTLKEGHYERAFRFLKNGKTMDVMASLQVMLVNNKMFLIKNFRDITKEVKASEIVKRQMNVAKEKNLELKKYIESNLQLENFAYIASHDLKAPIRSVISFAQLLKSNVYKDMDGKNQRFLDIIITASTNMQVLIDDLLSYSKINTQAIEFENVDPEKLLRYLLIEIGQNIAEKDGKVVIGDLPAEIVVDASRFRQIFQNLITNAMKFHKEGEHPLVQIECEDRKGDYLFRVKDHGIGIEPEYLEQIFLMFKKLHSENKFKGTGIGLSICKKIVEQHGGEIWAESTLGEGTTFFFTVSKELEVNI